jgi:RNA polymerase sigma factor (sigma-70 family)
MWMPDFSDSQIVALVSVQQEQVSALIKQVKERDFVAFECLYHLYKKFVWERLSYMLVKHEFVDDMFQETFLRVWLHLPEINDTMLFEAWLKRIMANLVIDNLRHEKKLIFYDISDIDNDEYDFKRYAHVSNLERDVSERNVIEQTIAQLPLRYRTCLLLQDHWGYSQREIAQLLGISEKGVSSYVSRSRKLFRALYNHLSNDQESTRQKGSIK